MKIRVCGDQIIHDARLPTIDTAAPTRPAPIETKPSALEQLAVYRRTRRRVFASALESNMADAHELELLNQVNREFFG